LPPQEDRHRHRPFLLLRSQTQSLTFSHDRIRADLLGIVRAGIRAVDAGELVGAQLARGESVGGPVWIIAAGKASAAMAGAAVAALGSRVQGGLVVAPAESAAPFPLELVVGEHPQPGAGSERAGRRALAVAQAAGPDSELLILVSGGASSLLAVPAEGLDLADKRLATGVLLKTGADIYALNTVRKHLSRIKGGRLAAASRAASQTFVLSDVVGDDLSVVASGPTVPDRSTFVDALRVIDEFGGRSAYPAAVVSHLLAGARGERPESPKPGDLRLARARTTLIGGRHEAMRGAAAEAARLGYDVRIVDEPVVGEARAAGVPLARQALQLGTAMARPACIVSSGETTVRVVGTGIGGRNQELAAAAAEVLAETTRPVVLASIGTDGVDGPTDAAGAIVDSSTLARAARAGLPAITDVLDRNDSFTFFTALDDLVRTGPSGTNVGDLQVFLLA
jgi:glycerate 2-kinase